MVIHLISINITPLKGFSYYCVVHTKLKLPRMIKNYPRTFLTLARAGGGGLMQLPMGFSKMAAEPLLGSRCNFTSVGHPWRILWQKSITGSGEVTEVGRHKRYSLRPIFQENRVFSRAFAAIYINGDYCVHFSPNSIFSRFSELIPCDGMWITKHYHFSPIKTAFSVRAREIKFW